MSIGIYTQGQPVTVVWKGRPVSGHVEHTFTWKGAERVSVWIPALLQGSRGRTPGYRRESFDPAQVTAR